MRTALELALTFAPLAVLLALLIRRCYPGEAAILRHRLRHAVRRLRAPRTRWRRAKARVATSVARATPSLRGPPVAA